MKKILIIEEQADSRFLLETLVNNPYKISIAASKEEAIDAVTDGGFDLIIQDVASADIEGIEFIRTLKYRVGNSPILVLSAKTDLGNRVRALELGASDFISKSMEPLEFAARVSAHIRTAEERMQTLGEIRKGRLILDRPNRKCFVVDLNENRKPISLTPYEYEVLSYLFVNDGRILTRAELMQNVWKTEVHSLSRTVDRHMSSLRKKLDPAYESVESIHGEGYRFMIKRQEAA